MINADQRNYVSAGRIVMQTLTIEIKFCNAEFNFNPGKMYIKLLLIQNLINIHVNGTEDIIVV